MSNSRTRGGPRTINRKNRRRAPHPVARCYLVVSPEYGEVIPILDDGTGPMEYGHDVVFAFARNARRAKVLALRWFRRQYAGKWRHNWIEDGNPFTGITVERMEFCKRCDHILSRPCLCCDACEGTGDGAVHGVEGQCNACNGTGRASALELAVDPSWSIPDSELLPASKGQK